MGHPTEEDIERGMPLVRAAPSDEGLVRLIVRRPGARQREILAEAELDPEAGLVGDDWAARPARGSDVPAAYAQLTLMNVRYAQLISAQGGPEAWAQAGDQLYVDLDISGANLPAGSRLAIGSAVVEISAEPHTGCASFSARFGSDALRKANSTEGRLLRLRGANAVVVAGGIVRQGDIARKL